MALKGGYTRRVASMLTECKPYIDGVVIPVGVARLIQLTHSAVPLLLPLSLSLPKPYLQVPFIELVLANPVVRDHKGIL